MAVIRIVTVTPETVSRKRSSVFKVAGWPAAVIAITIFPEHQVIRDVNAVFGTRCPCTIIQNMRSSVGLTRSSPENNTFIHYVTELFHEEITKKQP